MSEVAENAVRGEPMFVGDHPAMDFLNSIATPVDVPVEWLATGHDLIEWLEKARLITPGDAEECRQKFSKPALDAVAADARGFRDWLRTFVKKHAGKHLPALTDTAFSRVNQILADGNLHWNVTPVRKSAPNLQVRRRWSDPSQLLQPLAESAADLICHADFELIRFCEGVGCTLCFLDITKSHKRRWCSMAVCGNRAKAAAHRQRQRT